MFLGCCPTTNSSTTGNVLIRAVKEGNLQKTRRSLDRVDEGTLYLAFCEAVQRDHVEIAQMLLGRGGFSPHRDADRALYEAGPRCTSMLLGMGFSPDAIRLERIWEFCRAGQLHLVKALLPRFMAAARDREGDLLSLMVCAGLEGRLEIIKWVHGETSVRYDARHVRCDSGDCDLETLILAGQLPSFCYLYDDLGHAQHCASPIPFWEAMAQGQPAVLEYLVQKARAVDLRFNDDWLMREARAKGYANVVQLLLGRGVPARPRSAAARR